MIDDSVNMTSAALLTERSSKRPPPPIPGLIKFFSIGLLGALPGLILAGISARQHASLLVIVTAIAGIICAYGLHRYQQQKHWRCRETALSEELENVRNNARQQITEIREEQSRMLNHFHASSHRMEQTLEAREVVQIAAESLHRIFGFDRVNLLWLNETGDQVELTACHGSRDDGTVGLNYPFDHRAGILQHCAEQSKAYLVDDLRHLEAESRLLPPLADLPQLRSRSFIVCPINHHEQTIALFGVDNKLRRQALDQTDLKTVELFASQVSALLNRLSLMERSQDLGQALRNTFDELSQFRGEYLQLNLALNERTDGVAAAAGEVATATQETGQRVTETCSAAQEISTAAAQLSDNIGLLSEHLERVASSSLEMAATSREIDQQADLSHNLTAAVCQEAEVGVDAVGQTLKGLQGISKALAAGEQTIDRLSRLGQEIERLVSSINDINDRTSLLALNAAIIAAQAGDHGRPFAVVAGEIRSLSTETARSANSIEALVEQLQRATHATVDDFEATRGLVTSGLALGEQTSDRLDSILRQANHAGETAKRIRQATSEQATGNHTLSGAVSELKDLTRQCLLAIREQSGGTRQIVAAMDEVENQTGKMAAATEHHQQSTDQINQMVQRVNAMATRIFAALQERETESRALTNSIEELRQTG